MERKAKSKSGKSKVCKNRNSIVKKSLQNLRHPLHTSSKVLEQVYIGLKPNLGRKFVLQKIGLAALFTTFVFQVSL
jgi:hypothetical protein